MSHTSGELGPIEEVDSYVGSRLRARRIEVGLSQAAVGRHIGLSFSQVQKYEKGSNRIGAGRLYYFAGLLGVSVKYFFDGLAELRHDPASESEAALAAEAARLQVAFVGISDPNARQALLSLASSMGKGT